MSFEVAAESYGRFMGRYSEPLSALFADAAGVAPGQRALDVGCGPGALTAVLVERLGSEAVAAVDPSTPFLEAARARLPGLDIRHAYAEELPFEDGCFDVVLAQLVVHFMEDPVVGLREMARVTRPGGVVAACVWDYAGNRGPLSTFWTAVSEVDPEATDESGLAGAQEGHLVELGVKAGLADVQESVLTVSVAYDDFEQWWEPYTLGVGPAGSYLATLDGELYDELQERCRQLLPTAPFDVVARAWCMRGTAGRD